MQVMYTINQNEFNGTPPNEILTLDTLQTQSCNSLSLNPCLWYHVKKIPSEMRWRRAINCLFKKKTVTRGSILIYKQMYESVILKYRSFA